MNATVPLVNFISTMEPVVNSFQTHQSHRTLDEYVAEVQHTINRIESEYPQANRNIANLATTHTHQSTGTNTCASINSRPSPVLCSTVAWCISNNRAVHNNQSPLQALDGRGAIDPNTMQTLTNNIARLDTEQYMTVDCQPQKGFGRADRQPNGNIQNIVQGAAGAQQFAYKTGRPLHVRPATIISDQTMYLGYQTQKNEQEIHRQLDAQRRINNAERNQALRNQDKEGSRESGIVDPHLRPATPRLPWVLLTERPQLAEDSNLACASQPEREEGEILEKRLTLLEEMSKKGEQQRGGQQGYFDLAISHARYQPNPDGTLGPRIYSSSLSNTSASSTDNCPPYNSPLELPKPSEFTIFRNAKGLDADAILLPLRLTSCSPEPMENPTTILDSAILVLGPQINSTTTAEEAEPQKKHLFEVFPQHAEFSEMPKDLTPTQYSCCCN
ncbi:hypothetical protein K438DRAFT_1993134 [Mycena galopus ATCC 62051]|nr:hypothetical protein K438DRAFT_1993134 [Mycena galopus ATCC 62051]